MPPKKKALPAKKKPETREEHIAAAKEYERTRLTVDEIPEPTFEFELGEECTLGGLVDVRVEDIYADGKLLVISSLAQKSRDYTPPEGTRNYGVWAWYEATPMRFQKETNFAVKRKHHHFYTTDLSAFMHSAMSFGIDDKPEFQRDYVWTDADRERLLDSVFAQRDIGKFVLVRRPFPHKDWVLDGKQRLKALLDFRLGRYKYRGYSWFELSRADRYKFRDLYVQVCQLDENSVTRREMLEFFLEMNTAGVPISDEHIAKVRKMYDELKEIVC